MLPCESLAAIVLPPAIMFRLLRFFLLPRDRTLLPSSRSSRFQHLQAASCTTPGGATPKHLRMQAPLQRSSILSLLPALSDWPPAIASCWSPPPRSQTPHREGVGTSGGRPAWGPLRLAATLASTNHGMIGSQVSKQPQQQTGGAKEPPLPARPACCTVGRVGDSAIPCHSNPVPSARARVFS